VDENETFEKRYIDQINKLRQNLSEAEKKILILEQDSEINEVNYVNAKNA